MLEIDQAIDYDLLRELYIKGFSRIPVYERYRENVIGVVLAKDFIMVNPEHSKLTLKQL